MVVSVANNRLFITTRYQTAGPVASLIELVGSLKYAMLGSLSEVIRRNIFATSSTILAIIEECGTEIDPDRMMFLDELVKRARIVKLIIFNLEERPSARSKMLRDFSL